MVAIQLYVNRKRRAMDQPILVNDFHYLLLLKKKTVSFFFLVSIGGGGGRSGESLIDELTATINRRKNLAESKPDEVENGTTKPSTG